jgi:predicted phosphodiesterase
MKIAVLADIHSNFVALQSAVEHLARWQPDRVILAGDLVNRGPRPAECLEFFQVRARLAG